MVCACAFASLEFIFSCKSVRAWMRFRGRVKLNAQLYNLSTGTLDTSMKQVLIEKSVASKCLELPSEYTSLPEVHDMHALVNYFIKVLNTTVIPHTVNYNYGC